MGPGPFVVDFAAQGASALTAIAIDVQIAQDSKEPRAKIRPRLEPSLAAKSSSIGVLHEVLGVVVYSREVERKAVERVDVIERGAGKRRGEISAHGGEIVNVRASDCAQKGR